MKRLADKHPRIVRHITLPFETYEGRSVEGIEIVANVNSKTDGRPVFLKMGAHHAREWPSAEHAMEWAYELIRGFGKRNPRAVKLLRRTRTIVVPVVNPDGFNTSREAGELLGAGDGRDGSGTQETVKSSRVRTSTSARTAASSPTARRATASSRPSGSPSPASTRTATTAASGAGPARARIRPRRTTAAPARSPRPKRATSSSSSPGTR
jgi:Zinc carboxypeptidase